MFKRRLWIILVLGLFIGTSLFRFYFQPVGGHTWRQSDTLGMAMMFAEEVKARGLGALDFLLYPRILERGLLDGINATEFPLLDVLCGFFFLIGSPWLGAFLSTLIILAFNIFVAYRFLPRLLRHWQIKVNGFTCLVLWFSCATIAYQSNIFMPEGIAFPIMIMGLHFLLSDEKWKFGLGLLICNLGIGIKPTMVIALMAAPVLLFKKHNRKIALLQTTALMACLIFPFWWYKIHALHIVKFAEGPQIVPLANFLPLEKLREVSFSQMVRLYGREAVFSQFPMYLGWIFVPLAMWFKEWVLVCFYLLGIFVAVCLDGIHISNHLYYFMGVGIFSLFIMGKVLQHTQDHKLLQSVCLGILFWGVAFNSGTNIWVSLRDTQFGKINSWKMGEMARNLIPKNYHLVVDDLPPYPQKLLFIARRGTFGNNEPFEICNRPAYQTTPLAFAVSPDRIAPPICAGKPTSTKIVDLPFQKWLLVFAPAIP